MRLFERWAQYWDSRRRRRADRSRRKKLAKFKEVYANTLDCPQDLNMKHHGLPHQYPTQNQAVKYEVAPPPQYHGLPHQYQQHAKAACPHCGNLVKWDDNSQRYYCSRCQMFV